MERKGLLMERMAARRKTEMLQTSVLVFVTYVFLRKYSRQAFHY
jgi:hypothetical protein